MRERPDVPDWALQHIRAKLLPGEEVFNAAAFRHGLFQDLVLFNTSKGAGLVVRSVRGDATSALLTFPREMLTFSCLSCNAKNLLLDLAAPVDAHCSACGVHQRVAASGTAEPLAADSAAKPSEEVRAREPAPRKRTPARRAR